MYTTNTSLRVRYAETDQMGYVYYGNYSTYYEVARTDCLRQLGMSYKTLEDSGIMLPVVQSASKYIKPALYDDVLQIFTTIRAMPGVRIQFDYEIMKVEKEVIHYGNTTLAFLDRKTGKPCRLPDQLNVLFKPHFI